MASASSADRRRAPSPWTVPLLAGAIAVAALAAYGNSFSAPFVFDDLGAIRDNPTIRHFVSAFSPPAGGMPVSGRPLVNLSLALNYRLSGTRTWSYHALNVLIHVLAGWALFGVARRTLRILFGERERQPAVGEDPPPAAQLDPTFLGFAIAMLWVVHPLQTESVTYLSQRAESLMGLFYLLMLYCFIRATEDEDGIGPGVARLVPKAQELGPREGSSRRVGDNPRYLGSADRGDQNTVGRRGWFMFSVVACFFGMATKESMVTAPLLVLLYDRTFIAGGFREAWRRRRGYYAALGASWLLLALLVAGSGSRGGTAGFSTSVPWWAYAFTQLRAVAHYLRLSLWPRPLVFAYGLTLGGPPVEMAVDGAVVCALLVATAILLVRRPRWGFLGAWFFLILAPTSSVLPI